MKAIAFASSKGGVGKTALCHLFALGAAGWRNKPAYLFHTDNRTPMDVDRPYEYIDSRDLNYLANVIEGLMDKPGYCIIDGGGNRHEFDQWFAEFVDLILIPVIADDESVQEAIETMRRFQSMGFTNARYILNKVSSNNLQRQYDFDHFFSKLDVDLIAGKVPDVSAVKRLSISDTPEAPFPTPPAKVNNAARALHWIVDDTLKTIVSDDHKIVA